MALRVREKESRNLPIAPCDAMMESQSLETAREIKDF